MKSQFPENFYRSLFDNMLDGLAYCQLLFDKHGNPIDYIYIETNENFEKLTGLKGVVGKKATEIIPTIGTSNPELFEVSGRVSLTGKSERFETYIEKLGVWLFISVYRIKKDFVVGIFQNITDKKRIEKALENANTATRNVLEDLSTEKLEIEKAKAKDEIILASIGDGLVATDKDGKIIEFNKQFEKILGLKVEDVRGRHYSTLWQMQSEDGTILPLEKRPIQVALSGESISTSTYYYIKADGTRLPVAITASPLLIGKQISGMVAVFRDITREKSIDKAKTEFVSLASHQLRTPLGIMKWYLEALEQEDYLKKAPMAIQKYFDEVYRSNERVLSLVRDLLSVSRIEQERVKNVPESVDPIKIVKEIIEQMKIVAGKKGIELHLNIQDKEIPSINIDILRFNEVIENLVVNAIEYSLAGDVVGVTIKKVGENIFISVKDTGIGISKADQKNLFTKFFRGENAIEISPEGAGLGLYVVKSYVEGWGGKISVESVEGVGSTFTISLPIKGAI